MLALFISAFVTLFVVIDPPGVAPIFASLTNGTSTRHRRAMAWKSVTLAGGILLFFALLGEALLGALGVSLDAFRIAGGIMVFLIAIDMVFEKRTQRRENRAEEVAKGAEAGLEAEDISVFPMAIPMIAGPGSIAAVMLLTSRSTGWEETAVLGAALGANLLLTLGSLLAAAPLMKFMGRKTEAMITRLLGVILAALAAQFIIDGIRSAFALG